MNPTTASFTTAPFHTRPDLSIKRRTSIRPLESTEPFDNGHSGSHVQSELHAGWDKLYRARSILEAEQAHLRDDRITIQGEIDALAVRERAVAMREERIQQVEVQAEIARAEEEDARASGSAFSRLFGRGK